MNRTEIHLLPGLDGTGLLFQPIKKELSRYPEFDVHICTFPGDKRMSLHELTDYAINQIGETPASIVVAESLSSLVVLNANKRLRARGLVLCALFYKAPRGILIKLVPYIPAVILHFCAKRDSIIRNYCLGHRTSDEMIDLFRKAIESITPKVLKQRIRLIADSNIRKQLKEIAIPYCLIHPTRDKLVPSQLEGILDRLGEAPIHNVDAPHLVLQSAPEACADIIIEFIKNLQD